jgi:putative transcriptional regulator
MKERSKQPGSLAGQLLLAHPALRDPNFVRTVILMSSHDEEGAMGVVLNRPLKKSLSELNADFTLTPLANVPVYSGGPVETEKVILVAWQWRELHDEFQLNFGIEADEAGKMAGKPNLTLRAFLGYSGWTKGQLENEMKQQTWFTVPGADYNLNAEEGTGLWRMILGSLAPELKLLADEPEDPALN